jgi:hypothetical protein
MEIKIGSFYKTKDGRKVMCIDYDAPHYYFYGNKIVSRDDCISVISEWTEPRTGYVNIYRNTENGNIMSGNPQDTVEQCQEKGKPPVTHPTFVCIARSKYTEGQFDD